VHPRRLCGAALAFAVAGAGGAEYAPTPPKPLPPDAAPARVIVRFKQGAGVVREQALSARSDAATVRRVLGLRAAALGARRGTTLASGPALDARTQAVIASGVSSETLAHHLAADPDVEFAVPDGRRRRLEVPNDPLYRDARPSGPAAGQWYLRPPAGEVVSGIDAQSAWDVTTGRADIVVAVLDSGVRYDHSDLEGRLLPGHDMIHDATVANDGDGRDADASDTGDWIAADEANLPPFDECDPAPSSWHGTQTAGLIAAATNNGIGVASVGRDVRVLPVRVLGKCYGFDSDIIAGMRWAAGLDVPGVPRNTAPARVLNMSLGGEGACSPAYRDAVSEVVATGAVVVAAAGNSAGRAVGMPANCPGAIGVAALRHIGTKVGFSDLGPEIAIGAPGGNCVNLAGPCLYPIVTLVNSGTQGPVAGSTAYSTSVGTSVAAPLASGTAALMLSVRPALAPSELRTLMQAAARPFPTTGAPPDGEGPVAMCQAPGAFDQLQCYCTTTTCGAGMLDAAAAVAAAAPAPVQPPPTPPPAPPAPPAPSPSPAPPPVPAPEPGAPQPPEPGGAGSSGGGGGAMGWGWLLVLVAASVGLGYRNRIT
jgi:serine protease